jgi:hypothetical protein
MTRLRGTLFALFTGVILVGAILLFSTQGQAAPGASGLEPVVQAPTFEPEPTRGPAPQVASAGAQLFAAEFTDPAAQNEWTLIKLQEHPSPDDDPAWKIKNGMLVQNGTGPIAIGQFEKTAIAAGDESWQDYTLTASAYPRQNDEIGLVFRVQGNDHYRLRLLRDIYPGPRLILEKVVKGQVTELASAEHPGYTDHNWYTLAVTAKGATLSASINGVEVLTATDSTLTHGKIGVYGIATGDLFYDNIAVTAAQ